MQRDNLSTRLSFKACLTTFRSVVQHVASTCLFREDVILFKPARCATIRLRPIGFSNYVPCFNGVLIPDICDRGPMLSALVKLRMHLNKA